MSEKKAAIEAEGDEIRRLMYGALAAGRTKRWELVGTLVNALVHHTGLVEDPYDLLDYLVEVVENPMAGAGGYERGQRMRDLIVELSEPKPRPPAVVL